MDYVPAHGNTNKKDDRENVGGCRAFDGEDQGKSLSRQLRLDLACFLTFIDFNSYFFIGYGNRLRMQQLQQADWTNQ